MSIATCPLNDEQLLKLIDAIGDDGRTIIDREQLALEIGCEPHVLNQYTRDHASSMTNPKEMITRGDGSHAEHVVGIYGLDMLEALCKQLDLKPAEKMGRGWRARAATDALRRHLG